MGFMTFLFAGVIYFGLSLSLPLMLVLSIDEKAAVPGASPWRMRWPKALAVAGPVLYVLLVPTALLGAPWVALGMLVLSILLPWCALVAIGAEWVRRWTEDRRIGLARPKRW